MRKFLRILLIVLLLAFVGVQFFQPQRNTGEATPNDILTVQQVPAEVAGILKESCFDCHSNITRYHWYHRVSPVSWMIDDHVREGKDELNFSDWGKTDLYDKITALEEIGQETRRKTMPLKSYLIMHPKARLSEEQIEILNKWANDLGEELLGAATN